MSQLIISVNCCFISWRIEDMEFVFETLKLNLSFEPGV